MEYDVVLLPTFTDVEAYRKSCASGAPSGLFSQTATTFNAWIADLWELHGDGRQLVDSVERMVILNVVFEQMASDNAAFLTVSSGMVKTAASCVSLASGVREFEQALDGAESGQVPDALSNREAMFLQALAAYRAQLGEMGLVEVGTAAAVLAGDSARVFPKPLKVRIAHDNPCDWRMRQFFDSCPCLHVAVDPLRFAAESRAQSTPEIRFGFPSGGYAQPALVADFIRGAMQAPHDDAAIRQDVLAVVTSTDPLAMYRQLEAALPYEGVALCVQAQVMFDQTDFGKAFLSLCRVLENDVLDVCSLVDAFSSPFGGLGSRDAWDADVRIRSDRLAQRDEVLLYLRSLSDTFSQFQEVAESPEADILLGVFEEIVRSSNRRSPAWMSQQLGAIAALRTCTVCARELGAPMQACIETLKNVAVIASYEAQDAGAQAEDGQAESGRAGSSARVVVTTQSAAAHMGPSSCGMLVECDLTAQDYPVAESDNAASTLFEKIGLLPTDTALARTRRTAAALECLPVSQLVFMRPLNDRDGNPTYPCVSLQEHIDRAVPAAEGVDEVFGLPDALMGAIVQRGEELLWSNAVVAAAGKAQAVACAIEAPDMGSVPPEQRSCVLLPRRTPDGSVVEGPSPSPSQVELYLECPYKWFASRRLKLEAIGEGFGPLERGTFAHAVFEEFYRNLQGAGHVRVTGDNLAYAKQLMRSTFEDAVQDQAQMEPAGGRYVAANRLESREVEALGDNLVSFLDLEADLLPGFHPAYFEHPISAEDGVEYAGCTLVGSVDRIDCDDKGRAVVIDYKGSVNPSHSIAGKTALDPGKVQARMYARAIERQLGVQVVGAMYLSYGSSPSVAGAYDSRVLGPESFGRANVAKSACALVGPPSVQPDTDFASLPFSDMLDRTEDVVAQAVASMQSGNVNPEPRTRDACTYCPVISCPKRGA